MTMLAALEALMTAGLILIIFRTPTTALGYASIAALTVLWVPVMAGFTTMAMVYLAYTDSCRSRVTGTTDPGYRKQGPGAVLMTVIGVVFLTIAVMIAVQLQC